MNPALDLDYNPIDVSRSLAVSTHENALDNPDAYEVGACFRRAKAGELVSFIDNGPTQKTYLPKPANDNAISWPLGL